MYADDAMGGAELNCRIQLKFPQGFAGEVRLSREFRLSNSCTIECKDGIIHWDLDETNQLQIGLRNSNYYLESQLHEAINTENGIIAPGSVAGDFHQCFANQLHNVVAAIRGIESLRIPGEAGLAGLAAIENCYSQRALIDMPWLDKHEILRAQEMKDRQLR